MSALSAPKIPDALLGLELLLEASDPLDADEHKPTGEGSACVRPNIRPTLGQTKSVLGQTLGQH